MLCKNYQIITNTHQIIVSLRPSAKSSTIDVMCQRYSSQPKNQAAQREGFPSSSLSVILQYLELENVVTRIRYPALHVNNS